MNPICLGQCSLCKQTIFEKCPFMENGKLLKLFCLVSRGLNLPAGSDSLQNKILRGIRPRRTRSCGFRPHRTQPAGYQTPQNNGRAVYILLQKLVRGIKHRITTFKYAYFCKFKTEFKNILECEFGDYMGSIRGKNWRSKISCYCTFNGLMRDQQYRTDHA